MVTTTFNADQTLEQKLYPTMQAAHQKHKGAKTCIDPKTGEEVEAVPQNYIPAWAYDPEDPDFETKADQFGITAVLPDGKI
ncbi:hypothetical protein N9Z27_02965, partial [Alphaproteobacteria bacterium]|nr:hypothetical protein [Alphaproteobacteria bacterium]